MRPINVPSARRWRYLSDRLFSERNVVRTEGDSLSDGGRIGLENDSETRSSGVEKTRGESSSSPRTDEWSGFTRRAEKVVLRRGLRSGAVLQDGRRK